MNEELQEFISQFCGIKKARIKPDVRLVKDLGIDGDDGIELILAYAKKFRVDVSNFMATDYFNPEGDTVLPFLARFLLNRPQPIIKVLTINHLEKGISAGRLDENVIAG